MPAPKIRADHEQLKQIASQFGRQAASTQKTIRDIKGILDSLQGGDWIGKGATAFYREMDSEVMPMLTRLKKALEEAQQTTNQIAKIMRGAEDDAARILGAIIAAAMAGAGAGAASGGIAGSDGGGASARLDLSGAPPWMKNANVSVDVAGVALDGLGYLAGNISGNLMKSVDSASELMAHVFAAGGEEALTKTGIAEMVAERATDAARAGQVTDWLGKAGTGLDVVGTAGDTVEQAMETSAQTWLGKITSTGAAGGFSWAARNNPVVGVGDAVGGVLGIDTPSGIWNSSVESIVVTSEGLITGDTRGMESLHQKQLNGDWGPLFREAAEAGDFWAEHGIGGGLGMFWDAVTDSF